MGNTGAKYLANLLKVNTSLQFLNVSGNNLGQIGFDLIVDGISNHKDILSINASMNDIPPSSILNLAKILH